MRIPAGQHSVLTDLAELRADLATAWAANEDARALLRAVIDLAPYSVVVCDEAGTIIEWSRGAAEIGLATREEAIGRKTHEFIAPLGNRASLSVRDRADPLIGAPAQIDLLVVRSGETIVVDVLVSRVVQRDGRTLYFSYSRRAI